MTKILFATDRQAEHLAEAAALLHAPAFPSDAVAIAIYEDEGSKRGLMAIAVFHGNRGRNTIMDVAVPLGSRLTAAAATSLAAAAFHKNYLNKRIVDAHVRGSDRETQIALLEAGFVFTGLFGLTAVLSLDASTFYDMEDANAAG